MDPNSAWIFHINHGSSFHPRCSQKIQNVNIGPSACILQSTIPNPFIISTPIPAQTISPMTLPFPPTLPNRSMMATPLTTASFVSSHALNIKTAAPLPLPYYMSASTANTTPTTTFAAEPTNFALPALSIINAQAPPPPRSVITKGPSQALLQPL